MDPKKIGAGILGTTALVFGGVDASKLDEKPIERIETVAGYTVEAKQIENRVETSFPWKDQPAIKVVYDMGEPTLAEKFKDKRKKEVVTEAVDFGDGGFKVDILLDEMPDTNQFCYAIQGAENYDFFYQPPLTEQEIADGASRPPEIEGSYAVYHKTLKNHQIGKENYATGKVMHIPRPQVWSMSTPETKVWADMNYDNGNLCVTVPQDFLDKAEYPVRVDPTFGYTTLGASVGTMCSPTATIIRYGEAVAMPENGTLTTLSVGSKAFTGTDTAVSFTAFINTKDSGNANSHGELTKSQRTDISLTTTATWYDFSASASLVSGTNYVLGAVCDEDTANTNMRTLRDAAGSTTSYSETFGNNTYSTTAQETPWTSGAGSTGQRYSFYATYTAGGGGGSPTPNQNIILFE